MFIITDEPTTLYLKTQIFWRAETQVDILYFLQVNSTLYNLKAAPAVF